MAPGTTYETALGDLRHAAAAGRPGDRLPSMRDLTARYRASPVTISRVLQQLVAEGVAITRPGAGTYVAEPPRVRPAGDYDHSWQTLSLGTHSVDDRSLRVLLEGGRADVLPLASGYPHPSLTAARALTAALARVARRPGIWERAPTAGMPRLRRWFAATVDALAGEDDVLITSGGQSAISAAVRALVAPGGALLVEAPTYPGVLAVARAAGVRPVPVPVDQAGIRSDLAAEAFAMSGARVLYCQPTLHNPTGTTLSQERRAELMAVARAAGAFIIEDDWARWLGHGAALPPPLIAGDTEGRVVHIKSLTKTVAPSLRVGAIIARGPVAERLRSLRLVDDFFVPRVLQETAVEVLESTQWQRHLSVLNAALRTRRREMLEAVSEHLPAVQVVGPPTGAFYLWLRCPDGTDEVALAEAAERAGVAISAGRAYFATEPTAAFVRLSFVGPAHPGDMREGVRRLATVLGVPVRGDAALA